MLSATFIPLWQMIYLTKKYSERIKVLHLSKNQNQMRIDTNTEQRLRQMLESQHNDGLTITEEDVQSLYDTCEFAAMVEINDCNTVQELCNVMECSKPSRPDVTVVCFMHCNMTIQDYNDFKHTLHGLGGRRTMISVTGEADENFKPEATIFYFYK